MRFSSSTCLTFGLWEPLHVGVYNLLKESCLSKTVLDPGRLVQDVNLYSYCPRFSINYFTEKFLLHLVENGNRHHHLGASGAHGYWGMTIPGRPFQSDRARS